MRRILVLVAGLCTIALVGIATAPSVAARTHHGVAVDPTVYDSTISPNPGNVPSQSFEATGTVELGNQIALSGSARVLDTVAVQMSSWACQSGSWTGSPNACATTPGATFAVPITFNVFGVGPASSS